MNQQINLYHPIFRRQEKKFSAKTMLQAAVIVLSGVVLLYAFSWWRVLALRAEAREVDQEQQAVAKRIEQISRKFPPRQADPVLAAEVRNLQQRVTASARAYAILQHHSLGTTSGYSSYLIALSREHVPGLWLTGLSIGNAGKSVMLQGRSLQPDLVPRLLQQLSSEQALADINFQVFRLDRPMRSSKRAGFEPYVEFIIKTASSKAPVGDHS